MEAIAIIASLCGLFITGANVMIFCVIKFNDLAHLQKDVTEIKGLIKDESTERKNAMSEIWKRTDENSVAIAKVEGKLSTRKLSLRKKETKR